MSLREYKRKRDFTKTSEPADDLSKARKRPSHRFVIQKHAASRLHYDFRLELGKTLVSWAVPKGLPYTKGEKHLAVKVEDHPLSYIDFEGPIPKGEYGGGTVMVWDTGTFEPLSKTPLKDLENGKLHVVLHGKKVTGEWYLVRLRDEDQWLIIRGGADHKRIGARLDDTSVLSGKHMIDLAEDPNDPKVQALSKASRSSKPKLSQSKKLSKSKTESKSNTASKTQSRSSFHSSRAERFLAFIEPMKAKLVASPPAGKDWVYEIKFDGFRALAFKEGGHIRLLSRNNKDLAIKFPDVVEGLQKLKTPNVILDGEIVALDQKGRSSFQLLQAFELGEDRPAICFYVFDLLAVENENTCGLPLEERKGRLKKLLAKPPSEIRYSASLGGDVEALMEKAKKMGLEGLIGKRKESAYEAGRRSGAWIKLKLLQEQEFVIGGYTDPTGSRPFLGALLVGVQVNGKLIYCGKVGTGFTEAILKDLHGRFRKVEQSACPFANLPNNDVMSTAEVRRSHWLRPTLVCQVKFTEWTRDHRLRHPVYLGLREDKAAKDVVREVPA